MKIKIKNYNITAKAELDEGSDIWEVTDAIGGLLQVIGFGEDTVAKAIKDEEDQGFWLAPTHENIEKWNGCQCLCQMDDSDYCGVFQLNGPMKSLIRFIPIATLCG